MMPVAFLTRFLIASLLIFAGSVAQARGETAADKFYQAYYLEREKGDFAGAAKLYADVTTARDASAELQAAAKTQLVVCQEELASTDLARLMPPAPLAYFELNHPGDRVRKLLGQLGLLAKAGQPPTTGENRLAISPALVDALLGMRGAAAAVTGFDPTHQRPSGVVVLHAGNMEAMRGLIETALPAAAAIAEPIGGFPTYDVEGVYVTLTARLVIAGSSPLEIEGVIERMKDPKQESLATDPHLAEVLKDRRGELLFFCVNPKPLLPMLNMLMAAGAAQSREVALAHAALDPKSLRALTGRLDLGDEGLALELTLRLDEGHRNLVYNFFRRPAIDMETLRCVPVGAAGLLAMAMNEAPAKYGPVAPVQGQQPPVVTALDLGREIFANINGIAVCALPPAEGATPGGIPDIAAAITVNDPAKSEALWSELLGLASLATGAPTMDGEMREVAGKSVRSYRFDKSVTVQVAISGHHLLLATTESALTRALDAQRSGKSILDDPGFAPLIAHLGPHTTFTLLAHAGRCTALARPFMPADEAAELEPVIGLLSNTSAYVTVDHSDRMLRLSAALNGVPDVSGLVSKKLTEERQGGRRQQDIARAIREKQWDKAAGLLDQQLAEKPGDVETLRRKFDLLAIHKQDLAGASAVGDKLAEALQDNSEGLNNLAWELLTEAKYGKRCNELALRLARRSNELTDNKLWAYLDTLALAEFESGHVRMAIELEERAIELSKSKAGGAGLADMQKALERFRAARPDDEAALAKPE